MDKREYMQKIDFILRNTKDKKKIDFAKQILEKLQFAESDIQKLPINIQKDGFGIPLQNQLEWVNNEYNSITS